MDFATIAQTLIDWVVRIGNSVNDLPGTVAFGLGLFTWFAVEQVLQRVFNWLRWIILVGVFAGLGLGLVYVATEVFTRGGGAPDVSVPEE